MKVIRTILVNLFVGANIAVILLMWLTCLSTYLNPSSWPRLSLPSLTFPVFLASDLAFIIFWLIFKIRRVWIPIVGLLACGSFVRDYFPLNLPSSPTGDSLIVLTFNVHGFGGAEANTPDGGNHIVDYVQASQADVICLQECHMARYRDSLDLKLQALGYEHYHHATVSFYSRLPILWSDSLALPSRTTTGVVAHLLYEGDTILLINNHFESNHFTLPMREAYIDAIKQSTHNAPTRIIGDSLRRELSPIVRLLAEAAPYRATQADSINNMIRRWAPRPVILCGDFNETPVSYPHRLLTHTLTSAFVQSGNGLGITFHARGFPVRIDHILFSGDVWRSHHTVIDDTFKYSDHLPLSTILTRKTPKKR